MPNKLIVTQMEFQPLLAGEYALIILDGMGRRLGMLQHPRTADRAEQIRYYQVAAGPDSAYDLDANDIRVELERFLDSAW